MHKPTGDAALIKKINKAIVLECVLKQAPLSRAQISERTGLNKATVSNLVQELIAADLVKEIGTGESSGGRKPVMLLFNNKAGYAVGIDLGVHYVHGILTDLEGSVVAHKELQCPERKDVLAQLYDCIDSLIRSAPVCPYGIVGIGIGVPGIVDSEGTILFAPNLEWNEVPLRKLVSERFHVPVTIDNEANAGALGERQYGAGRDIANLVYVSAGIGIGTGIIIHNELYRGTAGFSGELGHLSISMDGPKCRCGNNGCWELYASEKALLQLTAPLKLNSAQDVYRAAAEGNRQAIGFLRQIGTYLGIGIANIINVFNPEGVIIGNTLILAEPWIGETMREAVVQHTLSYHRSGLRLMFAELREQSAVRGAAVYAIEGFLKKMKGDR